MTIRDQRTYTLLEFAELEIGGTLWQEYEKLGEPLTTYPFAKSGHLTEGESLGNLPFDNPAAATQAFRRRLLESSLAQQIIESTSNGTWVLEAREEDQIAFQPLDPRALSCAVWRLAANELSLAGRDFVDVSLRRNRPLTIHQQMVLLVREFARTHSPANFGRPDIHRHLRKELQYTLGVSEMNRAIDAADLPREWQARGRKAGRIKSGKTEA